MKYDELSDAAKQKAREWYAEGNQQDEWWDCIYDDAVICLGFLGFDATETENTRLGTKIVPAINFSGFCSQGDGACFQADWKASRVNMAGLVAHAPLDETLARLCSQLSVIALQYPDMTAGISTSGNYSHSGTMGISDTQFNDEEDTYDWTNEMHTAEADLLVIAREAADWIYERLDKENDYMNSDEYLEEGIEANEYEFDEDGSIE